MWIRTHQCVCINPSAIFIFYISYLIFNFAMGDLSASQGLLVISRSHTSLSHYYLNKGKIKSKKYIICEICDKNI